MFLPPGIVGDQQIVSRLSAVPLLDKRSQQYLSSPGLFIIKLIFGIKYMPPAGYRAVHGFKFIKQIIRVDAPGVNDL